MIVKCASSRLKPGMWTANPGLSQANNPHVYLVEGLVSDPAVVERIAEKYCDAYIDTEKGTYFSEHQQEKAEFECVFNAVAFSGGARVDDPAGGFDAILKNFKEAENRYVDLIDGYKAIVQRMTAATPADLEVCDQMARTIAATDDKMLTALLLVSRMRVYDLYSYTHSLNVSMLGVLAARHFGLSEEAQTIMGLAGILHDVGKIFIPDRILKKPGKLTAPEYAEVKRHPSYGFELLARHPEVEQGVLRVVHEHHENWDGTGYPKGIDGDAIDESAALISAVDTYDALRSDRYYKEAVSAHKAVCVVYSLKGKSFSPAVVDRFVKVFGIYPVGSIVVLKSGDKAIVTGQNHDNLLRPKVRVILNRNNRYAKPVDVNLATENAIGDWAIVDTLTNKECRLHISALMK